jgi:hypothetical protein
MTAWGLTVLEEAGEGLTFADCVDWLSISESYLISKHLFKIQINYTY